MQLYKRFTAISRIFKNIVYLSLWNNTSVQHSLPCSITLLPCFTIVRTCSACSWNLITPETVELRSHVRVISLIQNYITIRISKLQNKAEREPPLYQQLALITAFETRLTTNSNKKLKKKEQFYCATYPRAISARWNAWLLLSNWGEPQFSCFTWNIA